MPAIDLAPGTGSTTIVTTTADEVFWCWDITIIPDTAGAFELLAGSRSMTGEVAAIAGGQYVFADLRGLSGEDLILSRIGSMGVGGTYKARVK